MLGLSYGIEALVLSPKEIGKLEDFYRGSLRSRMMKVMPKSTATPIIYLLGVAPFEAQHHISSYPPSSSSSMPSADLTPLNMP